MKRLTGLIEERLLLTGLPLHFSVLNNNEQPNLPPLILLHGLFGMGDNLAGVGRALQEHFTVYKVDLRNHGRSARATTMTFESMAADVALLMEEQGIECAYVLGHSLGGKVAMQLALDHPKKVERLVVADIAPVMYTVGHNDVFAGLKAVDLTQIKSRRDADEVLAQYIDQEMIRLFILKNLYRNEQGEFDWRLNIDALIASYPDLCQGIETEKSFIKSVLFLKGENSPYIQESHRAAIMKLFPQAQIEVIEQASHYLHVEKPQQFNQAVKQFLL